MRKVREEIKLKQRKHTTMSTIHKDISKDTKDYYRIDQPGDFVYVMKNRNGDITFEITHENASLTIYGLYEGLGNEKFLLNTKQIHSTPNTSSHLIIKSVLWEASSLNHQGSILIQSDCNGSDATFESRHLLMGKKSQAFAKPELEILAEDVRCSHAVATSPPNKDILHYLFSRGIPPARAYKLIASGFLSSSF